MVHIVGGGCKMGGGWTGPCRSIRLTLDCLPRPQIACFSFPHLYIYYLGFSPAYESVIRDTYLAACGHLIVVF